MSDHPASRISLFWRALVEDGQAPIVDDQAPPPNEMPALHGLLAELDQDNRLRLAFTPPSLDLQVAEWACVLFYRASQFLVFRDFDSEVVKQELSTPYPGEITASTLYSADFALQHLGELTSLAGGIAQNDPLTIMLQHLGRKWPLSSVGIKDLEMGDENPVEIDLSIILADPCLRSLYVDRIIAHNDTSRLINPQINRLVRTALGPFSLLNSNLFQHLAKETAHEG